MWRGCGLYPSEETKSLVIMRVRARPVKGQ